MVNANSDAPVFTITYWGATGTLSAPLKPPEVTDKIVQAIRQLLEQGRLADLRPGPGIDQEIRRRVQESLPFHLRSTYGGNTTCVAVQTPDGLLILDSGSGFRELGICLGQRWNAPGYTGPRSAEVLITHPHMDHTFGSPYFGPYFDPRNHFTLRGTQAVLDSLAAVFNPASPLSHTYFPPSYDLMKALKDFRMIEPGGEFAIGSTKISTFALNHPGGCLAFRLENAGRVFVFATDHEHQEVPDRKLAEFARGADLFYTEGQYLAAEYDGRIGTPGDPPLSRHGWGHSPVESCVATAVLAGVRSLHIGHREPNRDDDHVADMELYIKQLLRDELGKAGRHAGDCTVSIPYEGLTVRL